MASVLPHCVANPRASPVLPCTLQPSDQVPSLVLVPGVFEQTLQQLLNGKGGSRGTRQGFSRQERGCGDGALPHGSSPGPAGHPLRDLTLSRAFLAPYLKASQTFLLTKDLQLPRTRRSSQWRVIASRGPDVERRHAPSPAGASYPLVPANRHICTARQCQIVESWLQNSSINQQHPTKSPLHLGWG